MRIKVGDEKRAEIMSMLESDVKFLAQLKIMDYSLLLGVHNVAQVGTWSWDGLGVMIEGPIPRDFI